MLSCEFFKIFKNLSFTTPLGICFWIFLFMLLFFATRWTNRNQFFFYFWTCFITAFERDEYHEFKNDLVVTAWEHTFLDGITWNLAVFCRLISISICTLCSTVLQLLTHGTSKRQIKSEMELEKAVILRCSQIFIKTLKKTPVPESLF